MMVASQLVQDFMTPNPVTVKPTDSVATVVKILDEQRFRGLPVVDDQGKFVRTKELKKRKNNKRKQSKG